MYRWGNNKKYNYELIIEILSELKKVFPEIKFYALGNLEEDPKYVEQLKKKIRELSLENNFEFLGFLFLEEVEKYLELSKIGFSFYDDNSKYYMYYGDPLKVREYALYGVVPIADGTSGVDYEMQEKQSGFIVANCQVAVEKILSLLQNDTKYLEYRDNCVLWASEMDKSKLLNSLYALLIPNGEK